MAKVTQCDCCKKYIVPENHIYELSFLERNIYNRSFVEQYTKDLCENCYYTLLKMFGESKEKENELS